MSKALSVLFICLIAVSTGEAQTATKPKAKKPAAKAAMTTQKEKMSYIIGFDVGKNMLADFKQRGIEVDNAILLNGLKDALSEKESAISEEETQQATLEFQQMMTEKQNAASAEARKSGETFLTENAKKEGVKVTSSGLQYKIITEGTGKSPLPTNTVVVHYRGKLIDGTVFDESYQRGEPATFQLNQVIKGWTEGLQLLKEGGKAELYIPADLGYGDRGAGQLIPPGAALIFEVELIKVQ
ncbi:MAG: FKBP-type peptidyl-prolyl cis-trans isomerase [Bacteroidota bacterium]